MIYFQVRNTFQKSVWGLLWITDAKQSGGFCPGSPVRDLAFFAERVAVGAPPHVGAGNASAPVGSPLCGAEWVMFEALEWTISK